VLENQVQLVLEVLVVGDLVVIQEQLEQLILVVAEVLVFMMYQVVLIVQVVQEEKELLY
jgi:hypothetical protein